MNDAIRFAKNFFIFLAIVIVISLLLNQLYVTKVLSQKNLYKNQAQFKESFNDDLHILFFGDSHPAVGINPEYIPNSFNLATGAENYEQTYLKATTVLGKKNNIQVIVLSIDLHSFSDYRTNAYSDAWYWSNFASVKELAKLTNGSVVNIYIDKQFPFIGSGEEFQTLFSKNGGTVIVNGWQKSEHDFSKVENKTENAWSRTEIMFRKYPEVVNKRLFADFLKVLDLAKENNKTVVLIKYPVTKECLDAVRKKDINIENFYANLEKYTAEYDNIYVLDYQQFIDDYALFGDADHLNMYGAEVLSKQVETDLQKLGLAS